MSLSHLRFGPNTIRTRAKRVAEVSDKKKCVYKRCVGLVCVFYLLSPLYPLSSTLCSFLFSSLSLFFFVSASSSQPSSLVSLVSPLLCNSLFLFLFFHLIVHFSPLLSLIPGLSSLSSSLHSSVFSYQGLGGNKEIQKKSSPWST